MAVEPRIAAIGECMVEFRSAGDGLFAAGFGGDTLNTAVYLARLGRRVDYLTALGDDPWSDRMLGAWQGEGVGTGHVLRVPGASPGLYVIEVDGKGERRFSYWRDSAPARRLLDLPEGPAFRETFASYDWLYLSGISLSLYGESGRQRLFEALDRARAGGTRVAFDTNFRPRGWPDREAAGAAFREAFARADLLFASTEDLDLLFGEADREAALAEAADAERVVKHEDLTVVVERADARETIPSRPVERVVDTTAAGDSFAAAYLSARVTGGSPREAALAGHRLAGAVVQHPGALIPREAMPA